MRRSTDRVLCRLTVFVALGFVTSCASERVATQQERKNVAPVAAKKKRQLSPSEQRELDLLAAIEKSKAKKLEPRALSRIEAQHYREIAVLRLQRGDEPGAIDAIERASRETWFITDGKLFAAVRASEIEIKRAIAMSMARRGHFGDALAMLDKLKMLEKLREDDRSLITGDRFAVLDMRSAAVDSGATDVDVSDDVATLEKIFGVSVLLEEPPPELLATETRGDTSATPVGISLGGFDVDRSAVDSAKHEADAELPEAADAPLVETGTIDLTTLNQMLSLNRRSIESCYSRALRAGRSFSGKLEVDIAVEASGNVSDADVLTREHAGTDLAKCVTSAIRRWKFPPIAEAKRMKLPFVLGRAL